MGSFRAATAFLHKVVTKFPALSIISGYLFLHWIGRQVARLWFGRQHEYHFGDVSSHTLRSVADALSRFIDKPLDDYELGDMTVATFRKLSTAFRRRRRAHAGLDAVLASFFAQSAVIVERCVAGGYLAAEDIDVHDDRLRLGITAAVLLCAACRSVDDTAARPEEASIVLASGTEVVTEVPEQLRSSFSKMVATKRRLAQLAVSANERSQLCGLLVGGPSALSCACDDAGDTERRSQLDALLADFLDAAADFKTALSPIFDANMDDVLVEVTEDSFGHFETEASQAIDSVFPTSPQPHAAEGMWHNHAQHHVL